MFSRQRAPGLWTFDSVVLGSEFEAFDANIANAIDGLNGGAYSLQNTLTIGGAPGAFVQFQTFVEFTNAVIIDGTLAVGDDADFEGSLTVNGPFMTLGNSSADILTVEAHGTFQAPINFNDDVFFNDHVAFGSDVTSGPGGHFLLDNDLVTIGADFDADLVVNSGATFNNNVGFHSEVTFTGTVSFDDDASFNAPVHIAASVSVGGPVTLTSGAFIKERSVTPADANTSFAVTTADEVFMPDGVLTATRDWTIDDTGAEDGAKMTFICQDAAHSVNLRKPGGVQIAVVGIVGSGIGSPTGTGYPHMKVVARRRGGVWSAVDWSGSV